MCGHLMQDAGSSQAAQHRALVHASVRSCADTRYSRPSLVVFMAQGALIKAVPAQRPVQRPAQRPAQRPSKQEDFKVETGWLSVADVSFADMLTAVDAAAAMAAQNRATAPAPPAGETLIITAIKVAWGGEACCIAEHSCLLYCMPWDGHTPSCQGSCPASYLSACQCSATYDWSVQVQNASQLT